MAPKDGGSVVAFAGTENETCVLSGFTIRDGKARDGGGILGGTTDSRTHAVIRNNRIIANTARVYGGGLAYCAGVIEHNAITDNDGYDGGGLYRCDGPITDNTISRNTAGFPGGGLHECGGLIANNTITDNSADRGAGVADCYGPILGNLIARNNSFVGGGGVGCGGTICNNIIIGNSCMEMGGGLLGCDGAIRSNLIAGNSSHLGGGLLGCRGEILNSTIVGNISHHGGSGGIEQCDATIQNCIIWGNAEFQITDSSEPTHSCIEGWPGGGTNTGADPLFVSTGHWDDNDTPADPMDDVWIDGDYRLQPDSPCIDVGDNSALNPPGLDLDGNLRIAFGKTALTVDMGAYEYSSEPFTITELVVISDMALSLTWNSQPNDTYVPWLCTDPM